MYVHTFTQTYLDMCTFITHTLTPTCTYLYKHISLYSHNTFTHTIINLHHTPIIHPKPITSLYPHGESLPQPSPVLLTLSLSLSLSPRTKAIPTLGTCGQADDVDEDDIAEATQMELPPETFEFFMSVDFQARDPHLHSHPHALRRPSPLPSPSPSWKP